MSGPLATSGGIGVVSAQYVTLAVDATLTAERVLTGTANQITITDGGAGSTVTLALPQDYDTGATPTLGGLTVNGNSATALLVEQDGVNDNVLIVDTANGRVGVNVAPIQPLTVVGTIISADNFTNNTSKGVRILAGQYASDAEPEGYTVLFAYSNSSLNTIDYGGGTGVANAATSIRFWTAANATTRTGTIRMWLGSNGYLGIGDFPAGAGAALVTLKQDLNPLDALGYAQNYQLQIQNRNDNNAEEVGIAFSITSDYDEVGAAITHHRVSTASQGQLRFYTKLSTSANAAPVLAMTIDENQDVGIGAVSPSARLHVDQESSTAGEAVLYLDQADIDIEFIRFVGSSEDSQADRSLVDAADMTTPGALTGWIQVYIEDVQGTNPITDGVYYIPFYAAPSA
jgi:hypothetical protein